MIIIDLMGEDDDIISFTKEDSKEIVRKEEMRKKTLEEIFRRSPQPQLQIVEIV